jgi:formamidopyrimidine-DNA glycosylase
MLQNTNPPKEPLINSVTMPELPEVETTRRGLAPYCETQTIRDIVIRTPALRWPIPPQIADITRGQRIIALERRAKYLIFRLDSGNILIHLGMSGNLRLTDAQTPFQKHDHVDIVLTNGNCLRLRDPRRFGALLWQKGEAASHPLLNRLGIEPLAEQFDGEILYQLSRCRAAIKTVLMDSHRIVGIGNIYANEALFQAGVHPELPAQQLTRDAAGLLATAIRQILLRAIDAGGSSLRDFLDGHGNPGYFQQQYTVYGRIGQPCLRCGHAIEHLRQQQRSSYFCPYCQKNQRQAQ